MPQVGGFIIGAMGWGGAFAGATGAFAAGISLGAGAGFMTTLAVRLATSVALSALSRALAPKPKAPAAPGIRTEATLTGGINPEGFILGRFATSGAAVCPPMSRGTVDKTPNAYLTYVIELSGVPGAAVSEVLIDGTSCSISQTSPHASYGNRLIDAGGRYTNRAWVRYHDGSQTSPDLTLRSLFGDAAARPWTAGMVGHGIAYAAVTFRYDREVYQQYPSVLFVLEGLRLYDPRKDTSAGGSGAQRWANKATWAFSENPMVMVYNILRGITLPSGDIWGGDIDAADLPYAAWAAAMDACDTQVAITGGTETAITAGGEVFVDDEPFAVIDQLLTASNAKLAERGGVWTPRVGGPGLPVLHVTDDDLLVDKPDDYAPFPPIAQVFNGIDGQWTDPESAWKPRAADPMFSTTWEAEDNGRRLVASLSLPMVTRGTQAERVMAAAIADHRRMRVHQITLGPVAAVLEPLDTITWTSASNGYTAKTFEVARTERELQTGLVGVTLREIDAGDFTPITVTRPAPPDRTPLYPVMQSVEGWDALAWTVRDAGSNARRAAIKAQWDPDGALDARGVRIAMRLDGASGDGDEFPLVDVAAGELLVFDVLPGESYQVRARYQVDRPTAWTGWTRVSAPDVRLSPEDFDSGTGEFFTDVPAAPAGLSASSQTDTLPGGAQQAIVYVSWSPASKADSYDLEIAPDGEPAMVRRVGSTSYSFVARPGSGWSFRVRGKSAAGKVSPWSSAQTHTATTDNTPPAVPTGLAAKGGVNLIWLTWDANSEPDLSRYEIFEATAASPAPLAQATPTYITGATSLVVQDLGAQVQRWFWIRAVDTSGNKSIWSSSAPATTAVGAAVDPADLQAVLADVANAGIVPANALAAHSVLATKLALMDFSSLVLNTTFSDNGDGWVMEGGAALAPPPVDLGLAAGIRLPAASTGGVNSLGIWRAHGIVPGDEYRLSMIARATGGAPVQFTPRILVRWLDADAVQIGADSWSDFDSIADTTPQELFGVQVAPAGAVMADVGFGRWNVSPPAGSESNDAWVVRPEMFRRNAAQLIVDGGIEAHHLIANEAVITGTAQIDEAVIDDANIGTLTSNVLTVNSLLKVAQSGALSAGKISPADPTDGLYFGQMLDEQSNYKFHFAASREGNSGQVQQVSFTNDGFHLTNAQHYVTADVAVNESVTATTGKVNMPAGTTRFRVVSAVGGGGGGAGGYGHKTSYDYPNTPGNSTIINLYDGATLKATFTADGAPGGAKPYQTEGFRSPMSPYGNGGKGSTYKWGTKNSNRRQSGGYAGQMIEVPWVDVSGWAAPQVEVVIGPGGPRGTQGYDPGNNNTPGNDGAVIYQTSAGEDARADVVPIEPTAHGTFLKAANTAGSFPDLGAGFWLIRNVSGGAGMALGSVDPGDGNLWTINDQVECALFASETPTYTGGPSAYTISYRFHSMGAWGD